MSGGWLSKARREFHATLLGGILTRSGGGVPSNADKGSQIGEIPGNVVVEDKQDNVALILELK